MYTGIAILIIVIIFIIVVSWYQHWVISYYLCTTDPTIWCYNDWSCESTPNQIGALECDGGNCQQAIINFYEHGSDACQDSCNEAGGCGCAWGDAYKPGVNVEDRGAICSMAKFSNTGPGMFACGNNSQRCPSEGQGCIPYCIDPNGDNCC